MLLNSEEFIKLTCTFTRMDWSSDEANLWHEETNWENWTWM